MQYTIYYSTSNASKFDNFLFLENPVDIHFFRFSKMTRANQNTSLLFCFFNMKGKLKLSTIKIHAIIASVLKVISHLVSRVLDCEISMQDLIENSLPLVL